MTTPLRIFFNHIPKSAGTSLGELLECAFPTDSVLSTKSAPAHALHAGGVAQALVWGHFGDVGRIALPDHRSLVALRDPWRRFRSLLRHAARTEHPGWTQFTGLRAYARTLDAAMLSTPEFERDLQAVAAYRYLVSGDARTQTPMALGRTARASLDAYDRVITEASFDAAAAAEADALGLPPIDGAPRLNDSATWPDSARIDPPREHERLLGESYWEDRAVYDHAVALATQWLARGVASRAERERRYWERLRSVSQGDAWTLDWRLAVRCVGWSPRFTLRRRGFFGPPVVRSIASRHATIDAPVFVPGEATIDVTVRGWGAGPPAIAVHGDRVVWRRAFPLTAWRGVRWRGTTRAAAGARGVRLAFDAPASGAGIVLTVRIQAAAAGRAVALGIGPSMGPPRNDEGGA